jgi:flagellar hook assembly protein FlgD
VGPSPGNGPVRIAFSLAHAAAVEIEVFDILGRRVATPAQGVWPAGAQVATWDGLTQTGKPASAGMYLIRYAYPGGQDRRRIMRVR